MVEKIRVDSMELNFASLHFTAHFTQVASKSEYLTLLSSTMKMKWFISNCSSFGTDPRKYRPNNTVAEF